MEQKQLESKMEHLPIYCRKEILIAGCGNNLFGDDGFGPEVVDFLLSHYTIPDNVCLLDVGTGIRKILFTLTLSEARPKVIVVIDAVDKGKKPGEVFEISLEEVPEVKIDDIWMQVLGWHHRDKARSFALAFELISNPVYPMPGLQQFMAKIHERCSMGIISNAQFYTPLLLERFFNASLEKTGFARDLLIFSYRTGYAKPSEHLFKLAEARLEIHGITPSETLYVGNDMLNDILPAQRMGFKTALFAGDKRSLRLRQGDTRCKGVRPDVIITGLWQLIDHI